MCRPSMTNRTARLLAGAWSLSYLATFIGLVFLMASR